MSLFIVVKHDNYFYCHLLVFLHSFSFLCSLLNLDIGQKHICHFFFQLTGLNPFLYVLKIYNHVIIIGQFDYKN